MTEIDKPSQLPGWPAKRDEIIVREFWTTGQVSALMQVSRRTVIKWCDLGVEYYVVPETDDRRITRDSLVKYLRAKGVPETLLARFFGRYVVVASDNPMIVSLCREAASHEYPELTVLPCPTAVDAAHAAALYSAPRAVIDSSLGGIDCVTLAKFFGGHGERTCLVTHDDHSQDAWGWFKGWRVGWPQDSGRLTDYVRGRCDIPKTRNEGDE